MSRTEWLQTNDQNDYFKGLVSGKKEYEAEVKEWVKGFTKGRGSKEDRGLSKDL